MESKNLACQTSINNEIQSFVRLITTITLFNGVVFFIIAMVMGYTWIDAVIFFIGSMLSSSSSARHHRHLLWQDKDPDSEPDDSGQHVAEHGGEHPWDWEDGSMQRILIQELQDGRSWAESLVSALIMCLWTKRKTGRKLSMTDMLMGMLLKLVCTQVLGVYLRRHWI